MTTQESKIIDTLATSISETTQGLKELSTQVLQILEKQKTALEKVKQILEEEP